MSATTPQPLVCVCVHLCVHNMHLVACVCVCVCDVLLAFMSLINTNCESCGAGVLADRGQEREKWTVTVSCLSSAFRVTKEQLKKHNVSVHTFNKSAQKTSESSKEQKERK